MELVDDINELFLPCISNIDNESLCHIHNASEIFHVLKSMYLLKALGLLFFTNFFLLVVGSFMVRVVQNFFKCGLMPRSLNQILIVFIPKCLGASFFS